MSNDCISQKMPWFELDRLIIDSILMDEWQPSGHVLARVRWASLDRYPVKISEDEIVTRIVQMVRLGNLGLIGDIWQSRSTNSCLCLVNHDDPARMVPSRKRTPL